jgi:hypothetical protein
MGKLGREQKETKEGRRWLQRRQCSLCPEPRIHFFWFTRIGERPISIEVSAPALFFYNEAMCEGSSGNGLLNAAKVVP